MFERCAGCYRLLMPWDFKHTITGETVLFTRDNPKGLYIGGTESAGLCGDCYDFNESNFKGWSDFNLREIEDQKMRLEKYMSLKGIILRKCEQLKESPHAGSSAFHQRFMCSSCQRVAQYQCGRDICRKLLCMDCGDKFKKLSIHRETLRKRLQTRCPFCNGYNWNINPNMEKHFNYVEKRFLIDYINYTLLKEPMEYLALDPPEENADN